MKDAGAGAKAGAIKTERRLRAKVRAALDELKRLYVEAKAGFADGSLNARSAERTAISFSQPFIALGLKDEARQLVGDAIDTYKAEYVSPYDIADQEMVANYDKGLPIQMVEEDGHLVHLEGKLAWNLAVAGRLEEAKRSFTIRARPASFRGK